VKNSVNVEKLAIPELINPKRRPFLHMIAAITRTPRPSGTPTDDPLPCQLPAYGRDLIGIFMINTK
jgi:hypothetical protein